MINANKYMRAHCVGYGLFLYIFWFVYSYLWWCMVGCTVRKRRKVKIKKEKQNIVPTKGIKKRLWKKSGMFEKKKIEEAKPKGIYISIQKKTFVHKKI